MFSSRKSFLAFALLACVSLLFPQGKKNSAAYFLEKAGQFNWNSPDSILFYAEEGLKGTKEKISDSIRFNLLLCAAGACQYLGKWARGIETATAAWHIARNAANKKWESEISNTLGLLFLFSGRMKESVPYFTASVEISRAAGNKPREGASLNNLANAYLMMQDIKTSLVYRKQALEVRRAAGNENALADTYNDIGETFFQLQQHDSALIYLAEAYRIKAGIGDTEMMSLTTMNMAKVYKARKNYREAIARLEKSYSLAQSMKLYHYLAEIAKDLSFCYLQLNEKDKAYGLLQEHIAFRDSVLAVENRRQLNELSEQFQSEKKELEIAGLKKEKEQSERIAQEQNKRRNTILLSVVFILACTAVYTFLLFRRFKVTRAQKQIIEQQKEIVEEKQKEILDSIHYAKRIQRALITNEKYISNKLKKLNPAKENPL